MTIPAIAPITGGRLVERIRFTPNADIVAGEVSKVGTSDTAGTRDLISIKLI